MADAKRLRWTDNPFGKREYPGGRRGEVMRGADRKRSYVKGMFAGGAIEKAQLDDALDKIRAEEKAQLRGLDNETDSS